MEGVKEIDGPTVAVEQRVVALVELVRMTALST
jgi:hypothetical protein